MTFPKEAKPGFQVLWSENRVDKFRAIRQDASAKKRALNALKPARGRTLSKQRPHRLLRVNN